MMFWVVQCICRIGVTATTTQRLPQQYRLRWLIHQEREWRNIGEDVRTTFEAARAHFDEKVPGMFQRLVKTPSVTPDSGIRVYTVNRRVSDFPDEWNLSTPAELDRRTRLFQGASLIEIRDVPDFTTFVNSLRCLLGTLMWDEAALGAVDAWRMTNAEMADWKRSKELQKPYL